MSDRSEILPFSWRAAQKFFACGAKEKTRGLLSPRLQACRWQVGGVQRNRFGCLFANAMWHLDPRTPILKPCHHVCPMTLVLMTLLESRFLLAKKETRTAFQPLSQANEPFERRRSSWSHKFKCSVHGPVTKLRDPKSDSPGRTALTAAKEIARAARRTCGRLLKTLWATLLSTWIR